MPHRTFVSPAECSRHNIFPGVDVHTAAGQEIMLSLAELKPHAVVEAHAHPHEQVGMVVEGRAVFYVGDTERELGPGDMYFIPGNVTHRVVALAEGCKALDVFHPIREDYL
jgi:quercetin dioxygenase-like cupin family protein